MATYNGGEYLNDQLQSFLDQTRQPDELVITDDCSTDDTEAIIQKFKNKAPFDVKFYRNKKNLGYCGNFNEALMKTTGDLVFLSDQDDKWFPKKIEHMINVAQQHPRALVLMNDAALTDADLNEVGLTKIGQIKSARLSMRSFVMGCCCAIRRELLDYCLPIPQGISAHDKWIGYIADILDVKYVDNHVMQYYRRHGSNQSQFIVNSLTRINRYDRLLKKYRDFIRETNPKRIHDLELFSDSIRNIPKKFPEEHQSKLCEFHLKTQKQIAMMKKRENIRKMNIFSRFISAMIMFFNSDYKESYNLKLFLRDLIG